MGNSTLSRTVREGLPRRPLDGRLKGVRGEQKQGALRNGRFSAGGRTSLPQEADLQRLGGTARVQAAGEGPEEAVPKWPPDGSS